MCDHKNQITELSCYFEDNGIFSKTKYSSVRCEKCQNIFDAKKTTGSITGILYSSWEQINPFFCNHDKFDVTDVKEHNEQNWDPSNGFSIMPIVLLVNAFKTTTYTGTKKCKMCKSLILVKKSEKGVWEHVK